MNRRGFLGKLLAASAASAAGVLVPEYLLDPPKGRSMVAVPGFPPWEDDLLKGFDRYRDYVQRADLQTEDLNRKIADRLYDEDISIGFRPREIDEPPGLRPLRPGEVREALEGVRSYSFSSGPHQPAIRGEVVFEGSLDGLGFDLSQGDMIGKPVRVKDGRALDGEFLVEGYSVDLERGTTSLKLVSAVKNPDFWPVVRDPRGIGFLTAGEVAGVVRDLPEAEDE